MDRETKKTESEKTTDEYTRYNRKFFRTLNPPQCNSKATKLAIHEGGKRWKTRKNHEATSDKEAIESSEADKWKKATVDEIRALETSQTWEITLEDPPRKPIGFKWGFKRKRHKNGRVTRNKATGEARWIFAEASGQ